MFDDKVQYILISAEVPGPRQPKQRCRLDQLDRIRPMAVPSLHGGKESATIGVGKDSFGGVDSFEAANRELQEEAGFGARSLTSLATLSLLPAYMTHKARVILAQDLYPARLPGDEPEPLEVVPWKLSELHRLLARDDVTEGRSIAALFIAREYLSGKFRPKDQTC